MLGQMLALKFGWMKGAKSARSFFIRPPLCNNLKLEYLKIDYTSIQTPDKMAYNGKPLSGRLAASNKQSSCFQIKTFDEKVYIFLALVRSFFSRKASSKRKVIIANGKSCTNWSIFFTGNRTIFMYITGRISPCKNSEKYQHLLNIPQKIIGISRTSISCCWCWWNSNFFAFNLVIDG